MRSSFGFFVRNDLENYALFITVKSRLKSAIVGKIADEEFIVFLLHILIFVQKAEDLWKIG